MSLKDGTIIEKSRPPAANEFIFFKRVVIDEHEIWDLFEYINSVSNINIKEIDANNIISKSNTFHNPVAIRINKK